MRGERTSRSESDAKSAARPAHLLASIPSMSPDGDQPGAQLLAEVPLAAGAEAVREVPLVCTAFQPIDGEDPRGCLLSQLLLWPFGSISGLSRNDPNGPAVWEGSSAPLPYTSASLCVDETQLRLIR